METKANTNLKTKAELEYEALQRKLKKMLDQLPLDDDEGGCGHGCDHKHHR